MNRATATFVAATLALGGAACDSTVRPIETTAQVDDCSRCHGYPPPAFVAGGTTHTTSTECSACHPGTVAADNVTIIPGGLHMNGVVDVTGGAAHEIPYVAQHSAAALANIASCTACHGADYGGGTAESCNACHAGIAASSPDWKTNCTFCHGTRTANVATATAQAAPPQAVAGATATTDPKVGAHQAHLAQGSVANAMPCASCHAVPSAAQALTHFSGNGAQGAVAFSALATKGVTGAAYSGGTCAVYCHGSGTEFTNPAGTVSPSWTASASVTCTTCHGNPPASGPAISGQTAHAFHVTGAAVACTTCHPVPPGTLGSHVNGTKDVVVHPSGGGAVTISGWDCTACHTALGVASGHAIPFVAQHTSAALSDIASCTACHGADYGGGTAGVSCNACHADTATYPALSPGFPDWKTNCTFCHGTRTANVTTATAQAAPPQSVVVTADQSRTNAKIGAHQAHLVVGTYANALPCATCHAVPSGAQSLAHFTGGTATVAFSTLASQGVTSPAYAGSGGGCTVYCHGSGTSWPTGSAAANPNIAWTATGLSCTSCHGTPPDTGRHTYHVSSRGVACSRCHNGYSSSSVNKATHPDGVRDAIVVPTSGGTLRISGWDCTACHNALGV